MPPAATVGARAEGHLANQVILPVDDVEIVLRVSTASEAENSAHSVAATVRAAAGFARSGDGGDDARRIDAAHAMVPRVGELDVPEPVGLDVHRGVEAGFNCGSAVAAKPWRPFPAMVEMAPLVKRRNAMLAGVGDEQLARSRSIAMPVGLLQTG